MAAAALPVAGSLAQRISSAAKADLVVINGEWNVRKVIGKGKNKHEILIPIGYELHVNPVAIGVGALALGAAAAVGYVAWNGLSAPSPLGGSVTIVPGLSESPYWSDLVSKLTKGKAGSMYNADKATLRKRSCPQLQKAYNDLHSLLANYGPIIPQKQRDNLNVSLQAIHDVAVEKNCPWVELSGQEAAQKAGSEASSAVSEILKKLGRTK